MKSFIISLFFVVAAFAQPPANTATDYEWELQIPNRTMFRDRTPIGQVQLVAETRGGLLSFKSKTAGEALVLLTEVGFCPGDSIRYYAAGLDLMRGDQTVADGILDSGELPLLWKFLDYTLNTAQNISATDRPGTVIQHRTKSGLVFTFGQTGRNQRFTLEYPAREGIPSVERLMNRDQLSSLKDLLDLAMYNLKRQGATIAPASPIK